MSHFFITLAASDALIVTPSVYSFLVSVVVVIKCRRVYTAVDAAVRVVVVVVTHEIFESRHVFWIRFGEVGKWTDLVF